MLKVGLTGGIGCGKSLAVEYWRDDYSIPVIDADQITRQLTQAGTPVLADIVQAFGQQALDSDGSLNRSWVRSWIFDNPDERKMLERIIHPAVREAMLRAIQSLHAPYCILVVPLLIEADMVDMVDCVVVVDCSETTQIQRVVARDQCTEEEVNKIIASQCAREKRLGAGDIIVNNDKDKASLRNEIGRVHLELLGRCDG